MKVAVVYESKTGNTERLAEEIYASLVDCDRIICNLEYDEFPEADFYFVGFGIHNQNCSMKIVDAFEKIDNASFALFMSCGFLPTEKYKEKLLKDISVWFPDDGEYTDSFLCQGEVFEEGQRELLSKMPESEELLYKMFDEGASHPDENDINNIRLFVEDVLNNW